MELASKPKVIGGTGKSANPLLNSNLPLDQCEGDPTSENIEFAMSAIYEMGILDKLKSADEFAQSDSSFCIYHSHALWSYKHRTTRHKDGTFGMSLVGIGPKLVDMSGNDNPYAKVIAALYKPQQLPPDLLAATITFMKANSAEEIATFEFERAGNDVWACTKHFTREELAAFAATEGAMKRQNPSNSCYMPKIAPEDMIVIISLIYGVPVSLPTDMNRMRDLFANAGNVCDPDVFAGLFPQWERAICEQALALDKSDPRSFPALIRLLLFSMSIAVPLSSARTATLAVFAEMAMLHKTAGVCFDQYRIDHKSIIGRAFAAHDYAPSIVEGIVNVMFVLVASVRVVTKTGLATKKKDSEVAAPLVSPPRDFSTPTVVVVDDDDDDATDETDSFTESEEVNNEIVEESEVAEQNNSRCPIS